MITKRGKLLFADLMAKDTYTGDDADALENLSLLARHAATYARLQVEECNGPARHPSYIDAAERRAWWNRWTTNLKRRQSREAAHITRLVHSINPAWDVKLQGDPRGYTVKLILPSGRYNTWGGKEEGYGIA